MIKTFNVLLGIDALAEQRQAYGRLAASLNLDFHGFASEAEARTYLEDSPVGAILVVGEQLAGGDPLQLIEHSRSSPGHASAPIAFVMRQRNVDLARQAMDAGATEVFLGPETRELADFIGEYAHASHNPSYSGKALLVEDDPTHAEYVSELCASLGFAVTSVAQAEQALETLKREKFHLLISDVVLGGTKTGIALIRQVRHELGLELPVILMSGFDDLPRRLLALRNGVGDFIAKPFAPEEFIWRVQRVMQLVALSEHQESRKGPATDTPEVRSAAFQSLSPREYEICQAVLRGLSDKEIAAELGISYWTVRSHVQQVFAKTGAINRRELMARQIAAS